MVAGRILEGAMGAAVVVGVAVLVVGVVVVVAGEGTAPTTGGGTFSKGSGRQSPPRA